MLPDCIHNFVLIYFVVVACFLQFISCCPGCASDDFLPKVDLLNFEENDDIKSDCVGEPLFLTPYLEQGRIREARELSRVDSFTKFPDSYTGFFTVNKTYNSNIFFWFTPSQTTPEKAPLLVWLQGGPGGSSLFGLFVEHGPFSVDKGMNLVRRNFSWNINHNVIYVDNPVGTGFSFTNDDRGYARNQEDVGKDLYSFISQFLTMFPELIKCDFYVTGESYAGKFVPALLHYIHRKNQEGGGLIINLKGMAIGDGFCDPASMSNYGDFLYQVGLLDPAAHTHFKEQSQLTLKYISEGEWIKAFYVFDNLLNGDLIGYPSYFTNVTGSTNYFNYLLTEVPEDNDYWSNFVKLNHVRKAIHVGNSTFNDGKKVEAVLLEDFMQGVGPWVEEILDHYRVAFYSGQLDIIVASTLTDSFLNSLTWKHSDEYKNSARRLWRVDGELAGYVRMVPDFVQVLVRNAGHMVPYDQPKWAFDLITRFTHGMSFTQDHSSHS